MKSLLRAGWLAILVAMQGTALAEEARHPVKPMLWKVEGKALTKPSFLFGTLHVGKPSVTTFHPTVEKAFEMADVVYTEVPMDAGSQVAASSALIRQDGKKLSDSLGKDLSKQLETELGHINKALTSEALQSFKTWAVATVLPVLRLQLTGGKMLDALVWERAVAAGKKTGALEKPEDQLRIFDTLSEEEQVALLSETLLQLQDGRKKGEDPVGLLVTAYVAGDAAALDKEINSQIAGMADSPHKELGEKLMRELLENRNVSMTETITVTLGANPGQSHFFAVGSGHYVGKDSIVDLLTAKGYQVTRLTE